MLPTLLCIARDPLLVKTRLLLLSPLYSIEGVTRLSELTSRHFDGKTFDLILLCHTLADTERQAVVSLSRARWPHARLLALTTARTRIDAGKVDAHIGALEGPGALLQRIADLLRRSARYGEKVEGYLPQTGDTFQSEIAEGVTTRSRLRRATQTLALHSNAEERSIEDPALAGKGTVRCSRNEVKEYWV